MTSLLALVASSILEFAHLGIVISPTSVALGYLVTCVRSSSIVQSSGSCLFSLEFLGVLLSRFSALRKL